MENKKQTDDVKELKRCEKCGGSFTYFSIKKNGFQCRNCGHLTKAKNQKEEDNE